MSKCKCCEADQEEKGRPMRDLRRLRRSTMRKGLAVMVCEFCDGPVLMLGTRTDDQWFDPDIFA